MGSCNFNNPVRRMKGIAAGFMLSGRSGAGRSIAASFWPFQQAKSPRYRPWKKSKRPGSAAIACGNCWKCWATTEESGRWPRGARVFLLRRSTPHLAQRLCARSCGARWPRWRKCWQRIFAQDQRGRTQDRLWEFPSCYEGLETSSAHFLLCANRDSTKFGMTGLLIPKPAIEKSRFVRGGTCTVVL